MLVPMRSSGDFSWGPIGSHFVRCALRKQSDSRSATARCCAHFRHPEGARSCAPRRMGHEHPTHPSKLAQRGLAPQDDGNARVCLSQQKSPRRGFFRILLSARSVSCALGPDLLLGEIHQFPVNRIRNTKHLHAQASCGPPYAGSAAPHQERGGRPWSIAPPSPATHRQNVTWAVVQRLRHLDGVAGEILVCSRSLREW